MRVAGSGEVLGVQLEPPVMGRPGHEIAARIQACADVGISRVRSRAAPSGKQPECLLKRSRGCPPRST